MSEADAVPVRQTAWEDRYWTGKDGVRIHYRDYAGPADRPPVLMLHGLTRNVRDFENAAERLAGDWRVIAVDFRGRGLSAFDPQPERYHPPIYAHDMIELLAELGIDRAVMLGTSLGGLVIMLIAVMDRSRIAGALLNDVGPELDDAGLDRIKTYVGKPVRFSTWEEAAADFAGKFSTIHPSYGQAEWIRYAKRVCRQGETGIEFDYDMRIVDAFEQVQAKSDVDTWAIYRALAGTPLTILRGERSDLLSEDIARRMVEEVDGAELVVIPGVGHAPDLDEPESVLAIDLLLQRVLDGERG